MVLEGGCWTTGTMIMDGRYEQADLLGQPFFLSEKSVEGLRLVVYIR